MSRSHGRVVRIDLLKSNLEQIPYLGLDVLASNLEHIPYLGLEVLAALAHEEHAAVIRLGHHQNISISRLAAIIISRLGDADSISGPLAEDPVT